MKPKGRHPSNALNVAKIRTLRVPGMFADGNGLYLRVDQSGARRWVQILTVRGKRRNLGLGGWPLVPLAEARERALENRRLAREGGDPLALKRQAATPTFAEAATAVFALKRPTWSNRKDAAQWETTLQTYAFPVLGAQLVSEITSGDVLQVLTPIWTAKPEVARRVRQRIGTVLDWAIVQGYRADNPAGDALAKALPRTPRTQAHPVPCPTLTCRRP